MSKRIALFPVLLLALLVVVATALTWMNFSQALPRSQWAQALQKAPSGDAGQALLRLEIASEAPTPAEHLSAKRLLQLQMLTRRNAPSPEQTWGEDAAAVLASASEGARARRLQNALKALLRKA